MGYPSYRQHVVVWFLIVVQASSALRGGYSNHNGRIFSAFCKQQDIVQQQRGAPSSLARRKSRTRTALQVVAKTPSDDEKDDVDLSKLGHDRLGEVLYEQFGESVNSITGKNKNEPYEFGDLTKWVDRQARTRVEEQFGESVNSITGKNKNETYEFGDLTKWVDRQARTRVEEQFGESVNSITGKDKNDPYEFGDLTKWVDRQARTRVEELPVLYSKFGKRVNSITGKNKNDPYEFGDLTKWLIAESRSEVKEVRSGEEDKVSDFISVAVGVFASLRSLLLINSIRLVVKFGIERPVLTRLPSTILVELVHLILDGNYRPQILRVVATELDKRFKEAIFGDEDYKFGDLTKKALLMFTGKEQYKFGDITKELLERAHASEDATARYMDQVQNELHVLEDNAHSLSADSKSSSPPRRRRGTRIPALRRWFQK
jgi:hypothetical protein